MKGCELKRGSEQWRLLRIIGELVYMCKLHSHTFISEIRAFPPYMLHILNMSSGYIAGVSH